MNSFVRGTTPIIEVKIKKPVDFDMSNVVSAKMTLKNKGSSMEKFVFDTPDIDVENKTVSVHLTQEQSLKFYTGIFEAQVELTYLDGNIDATNTMNGKVNKNIRRI